MKNALSVRIDADNPNHHLWNNNGTWWCHYTVHPTDHTTRRERVSLRTRNVGEARQRRDALFCGIGGVAATSPGAPCALVTQGPLEFTNR